MAHVSVKSHANAVLNPKAHLRKAITEEQVMSAPIIAHPLGLYDCCGVSDGAACAIVATPEKARQLGIRDFVTVKALQLALSSGAEMGYNDWDGDHFITTAKCSAKAYAEAGINRPQEEISMIEVHDCFSITELVTMEDLHLSERGRAVHDILDGVYDRDGDIPCQVDGGLKCFGHPIGASGIRMLYEMYLQLNGRADERQIDNPRLGLTHNLGGFPFMNICSVSIIGRYGH
jgi:acetyl-CoA C-acetyltransferase